ncbi:hypothetical protein [Sphingosinicella rhizophila]|uniref:Porin n=1 Tax=Sphingosinicella rhizophila TaxID=3050082 RepID=A0ABU3Q828_9SPHN|nr:hypothetical protein [Sphingosinicella sp. GR2756]MDT9599568.1 hypothetical protein [Sphingosinicella sp. GR2756]
MKSRKEIGAIGGAAFAALSLLLSPALAESQPKKLKTLRPSASIRAGNFTPAVADPRLAAELAKRGLPTGSFRFTPAAASPNNSKAVRVAVRARATTPEEAIRRAGETSASTVTAITPSAYNLGVAIGWKRFAISGDVARIQGGAIPGGREAAEIGVSYAGRKFTGRLDIAADRTDGTRPKALAEESGYSVGVGGSYRIARNIDLTGGVRYRIQNDRLEPLVDERRDSQAVYIGTAFRF